MKLTRDAFLYMEPAGDMEHSEQKCYAACATCFMWDGDSICHIHGKEVLVTGDMSCGIYVYGKPDPKMGEDAHVMVTPSDSGLVLRDVRCENCYYGTMKNGKGWCKLFDKLNKTAPRDWNLDPVIELYGCCNGHRVKDK